MTNDATTNVTDVQCNVLVNLWTLGGGQGEPPICAVSVGSPVVRADHNCDGVVNISDTLMAVGFSLGFPLSLAIDADGDNCADACASDADGDGDFDFLDCAPLDPAIHSGAAEVCNGYDDNCNGLVDEAADENVDASCHPGTACIVGTECSTPTFLGSGLRFSEVHALPSAAQGQKGQWVELFNPTASPINIAGFALGSGGTVVHVIWPGGGLFVPAAGHLALASSTDAEENGGVWANYGWGALDLIADLQGSLQLLNPAGLVVDAIPLHHPAFPLHPGRSTTLVDPIEAGGDPANWTLSTRTFGAGDQGTPGGPNVDVLGAYCASGSVLNCDDGIACTQDSCDAAAGCLHLPIHALCNDNNLCTDDSCSASAGCVHLANSVPCEDGNPCTQGDICAGGICAAGSAIVCDDGNPCTVGSCTANGQCSFGQVDSPCSDGNACTTGDTCVLGFCVVTGTLDCSDNNPCTVDFCSPAAGCVHVPTTGACDDGNACTQGESCIGGACQGGATIPCDDGNLCTLSACTAALGCVHAPTIAPCNDGDVCTINDACQAGICAGTGALNCADGNPCTLDTCDPVVGCNFVPTSGPCNDGNACTVGESCASGTCSGGSALACNDSNPCTDDSCLPTSGCLHTPNSAGCSDGNACTTNDICLNGACVGSGALSCSDGNPCTNDSCNPSSGCVFAPNNIPCNDGNACTPSDNCQGGACVGSGSLNCNDGNPCTNDSCNPSSGCVFAPNNNACNDGNACTPSDNCQGGACVGSGSLNCNDGNPCTNDSCNPSSGCVYNFNNNPCNDFNACTTGDICQFGSCVGTGSVSCNDNNPCTTDTCSAQSGCVYTNTFCSSTVQIYRMWWVGNDHMDSKSPNEGAPTYIAEGAHYALFNTKGPGFITLHRKYYSAGKNHMTTSDPNEGSPLYVYEAELGHCSPVPTPQASKHLRRMYNPSVNDHITVWAQSDINNAIASGYVMEHTLCYVQ